MYYKTINIMIADFNTVPMVFSECNKKYFNHELPTPSFDIINKLNILARFEYRKNKGKDKTKKPLSYKKILFSNCYDFDEKDFINILVHEMIHYYIAWNNIKDNKDHGREFMRMATELNEKYGLNITKTVDASSFKKTENAPKSNGLFSFLLG